MGAVFERDGLRRAGAAVAADDATTRRSRGSARPSRHALRPGARGPRRRARELRVQGVRRRAGSPAASCAGSTPARASCRAPSSTRSPSWPSSTGPRGWCGRSSEDGGWRSPIAKFLSERRRSRGDRRAARRRPPGDLLLIVADERRPPATVLGALRLELGRRFGLDPGGPPRHPLGGRVPDVRVAARASSAGTPMHHPFTAPSGDLDDPGEPAVARLRPRARRLRDRRRLDPYPPPRDPAEGLRAASG